MMRLGLLLVALLAMPVLARAGDVAGRFDFYVLSLSWAPTYCDPEGQERGDVQCRPGRRYGFVVHGLWPQYERGYPQECPSDQALRETDVSAFSDLMPARGLVRHEWRKHGTCSGLAPAAYFDLMRAARQAVQIPAAFQRPDNYVMLSANDVEAAFVRANPGLRPGGVAIICDGRRLREVRVCLTRDLGFRACEEVDRRGCRAEKLVLPPVR